MMKLKRKGLTDMHTDLVGQHQEKKIANLDWLLLADKLISLDPEDEDEVEM